MKHFFALPALLLGFALVPAYAQDAAPEFSTADADGDGELSMQEAQGALPSLAASDGNGDGMLNQAEAEAALPGLRFSEDGSPAGEDAVVGEAEYQRLVRALEAEAANQGV